MGLDIYVGKKEFYDHSYSALHLLRNFACKAFDIPTTLVGDYKIESAIDAEHSMFPNLLWHSDADGDYVPKKSQPATLERGSSYGLLEELNIIKPMIDALANDETITLKSDETDGKYLKMLWQELHDAAEESINKKRAMRFS